MPPQPFLNDEEPFRCVRFTYVHGRSNECILLHAHCTSTVLAYMDYFDWVINTVSFDELRPVSACGDAQGIARYVTFLLAEEGVPDSVGAAKSMRTGGIGRHIRFETIVNRHRGRPATLLVLLETMSIAEFESMIDRCAETAFRDEGEARYCMIQSKGCMLTHLTLADSENMRAVIARLAWAGLTVCCTNSDEFKIMQYTPERLVRVAKTWKINYMKDPINLAPKPEDAWSWHGTAPITWPRQFYTMDGLGAQIAKVFDVSSTRLDRVPYPLRCYVQAQLDGIQPHVSEGVHASTPRVSDRQMMQMNHCAYVREFSPYDAPRKARSAAISWMYLIHGHIVRIVGTYNLTGRFRGLGWNLRVFGYETADARHIAPESMGRIVWTENGMFGQKHEGQTAHRPQPKRRCTVNGASTPSDFQNPVA